MTSLDFLDKFRPGGPWLLTAIPIDGGNLTTFTFTDKRRAKITPWLKKMGENHNLYFCVNPTKEPINNKAKRIDIAYLEYLHVDVDPRAGEDLKNEQERIIQLFRDFSPAPTFLVFSGGGYQGFWKLEEPIPLDGTLSAAEDAKRWNLQLEILLGGDSCHSIDHVMRIPGTMNHPNERKRARGRQTVVSKVVYDDVTNVYPISRFTAAHPVQVSHPGTNREALGGTANTPKISGNIKRLSSPDDLPDEVKPWVKVLIVQGKDPDNPTRFESRSHALFAVVCELVRASVDVETIFSVITDPDFKISASVVELGARAEAYALKQIKSALEQAEAPELRELNDRHAVIASMGGKCRVISREWDYAFNRTKIVRQSFDDIRNRYMNRLVEIGKDKEGNSKFMPLGKWWLGHKKREQFDSMIFLPGQTTENAFNLWQGFNCESKPGGSCQLLLDHLKGNICRGVDEHYDYLVTWMASAVQFPDRPAGTAVVMRGKQGTGKGVFAQAFGYLFGQHFLQVTNCKHLVGNFNHHLRDCVILFADEAFYAGNPQSEQILKGLVTEQQLMVEPKGIDAELTRNFLHIIMASNSEWVVPVGHDDRRFFVLDVSDAHREDVKYFRAITQQLKDGGYEAFLYMLMCHDIKGFEYESAPKTDALQEQKQLNLSPEEAWWLDKLHEGRSLVRHEQWETIVPKEELYLDYIEFIRNSGGKMWQTRCTKTRMTRFLNRFCPIGFPRTKQISVTPDPYSQSLALRLNTKPVCYVFPRLQECRQAWQTLTEAETVWQDTVPDDSSPPF